MFKCFGKFIGAAALGVVLMAGSAPALATTDNAKIAMIELTGSPRETPGALEWLFGSGDVPTLRSVIEALDDLAGDKSVEGIVIRLKDSELSSTQVQEIGKAIQAARAAGKKVHIFGESLGATDLMLGSYADEVMAQEGGDVSFPGLYMEEMFLADTLAWVGLKADYVQVGDYKGASEQMARSGPSPQWDQNINQLLDSLYANMRQPLLTGRKMTDKKLDDAMEVAWMSDAKDAVRVGLVDAQVDLATLTEHMKSEYKVDSIDWDVVELGSHPKLDSSPFALFGMLSKEPDHKPRTPTIAILHIDGAIVDGDSTSGGMFGGEGGVGSRTIRNALEDILAEPLIKGVVVRIDSPGGSATASEVIWQGIRRVQAKKPVWVSVGSMAASGGYYCAVAGEKIYVNPSSIVGSIGVVGGKLSMQGLYDLVKVKVVGRGRGPRSGMFSSANVWSPQDIELVRNKMKQTYTLFTSRVESGRKGIDLTTTAEGRLFTGDKAIERKMADTVGGLDDCLTGLAQKLDLDDYAVMDYPGPKALGEVIEDALGGMVEAPQLGLSKGTHSQVRGQFFSAIREVVGPRAWKQIGPSLEALMQLRDQPVLLLSPRVLIFK